MEILANELRIGNWVRIEKTYNRRISGDDLAAMDDRTHHLQSSVLYSDPIPLTPEILEKAGFKKHLDKGSPFYFLSGIRYNIKTNVLTLLRSCDKAGESQPGLCGNSIGDEIKIQYLHQLQNLIFALTGNELDITL